VRFIVAPVVAAAARPKSAIVAPVAVPAPNATVMLRPSAAVRLTPEPVSVRDDAGHGRLRVDRGDGVGAVRRRVADRVVHVDRESVHRDDGGAGGRCRQRLRAGCDGRRIRGRGQAGDAGEAIALVIAFASVAIVPRRTSRRRR
jgi:hypothetical protein